MSKYYLLITLILLLASCSSSQENTFYDIRGKWDYTMIASDGNTYDLGTITFSGQLNSGEYELTNIYDVTYHGLYAIEGNKLFFSGDETWNGIIENANSISGTWTRPEGIQGTFNATR